MIQKKEELIKIINELKSMDIDMYLFYVEDLIKEDENIGEEVIDQLYLYSDLFDTLSQKLEKLS